MQLFICETLHRIVGRFLLVLRIEVLVCVFKGEVKSFFFIPPLGQN